MTHCGFTIAFVIILLNVPVLVTNGYSIEVNGTEKVICYAWYYNDYTIFDIMGQVGFLFKLHFLSSSCNNLYLRYIYICIR